MLLENHVHYIGTDIDIVFDTERWGLSIELLRDGVWLLFEIRILCIWLSFAWRVFD